MRDSRTGAFGVVAVFFSLSVRIGAIAALAEPVAGLVAAAGVSRMAMVPVMAWGVPARKDGLGAGAGRAGRLAALAALVLGVGAALLLLGPVAGNAAAGAALVAAGAVTWLARRHVGGYTGDVLGAVQQIAEMAALLCLVGLSQSG